MDNLFEIVKFNAVLTSWECSESLSECIIFSIHYSLNMTGSDDNRLYLSNGSVCNVK